VPASEARPGRIIVGVRHLLRRWFDLREPDEDDGRPDYRFSLANERTFLAWIRTSLALVGGGLAVTAFVPRLRVPGLREAIALALLVLGGAVAIRAVDHWARSEAAIRRYEPLPPSRFPAVLALIIAAGTVLLIIVVVAQWPA
jgi:inner membrane protein YidH